MRPADLRRLDAALSMLKHPAKLIRLMRMNIISDYNVYASSDGVETARWRLDLEIASMAPVREWDLRVTVATRSSARSSIKQRQ